MASMSLRSAVNRPPITPRRLSDIRQTPIQISPPMKCPQIRSILTPQPINKKSPIMPRNLDDWVYESAAEIVRNLPRAPLLVHVHDDGGRVETEAAEEEEWQAVAMRWRDGGAPSPDGVMLVEEIGEGEEERDTKVWGIVVQGKGCGPRCYLLKTCQIGSGLGLGCTHFCLIRVRDWRESALSQLNSCWLFN